MKSLENELGCDCTFNDFNLVSTYIYSDMVRRGAEYAVKQQRNLHTLHKLLLKVNQFTTASTLSQFRI